MPMHVSEPQYFGILAFDLPLKKSKVTTTAEQFIFIFNYRSQKKQQENCRMKHVFVLFWTNQNTDPNFLAVCIRVNKAGLLFVTIRIRRRNSTIILAVYADDDHVNVSCKLDAVTDMALRISKSGAVLVGNVNVRVCDDHLIICCFMSAKLILNSRTFL